MAKQRLPWGCGGSYVNPEERIPVWAEALSKKMGEIHQDMKENIRMLIVKQQEGFEEYSK